MLKFLDVSGDGSVFAWNHQRFREGILPKVRLVQEIDTRVPTLVWRCKLPYYIQLTLHEINANFWNSR